MIVHRLRRAARSILWSLLLVVAASPALLAQADVIKLKRGAPIVAKVWDQEGPEITYNVFRTAIRRVTHGTEKIDARSVTGITPDPDVHRRFWRRAAEISDGPAEDWFQLGMEARAHKLRGLPRHGFIEALLRDRGHARSLQEVGAEARTLFASDPRFNRSLREKLDGYLALETPEERAPAAEAIAALGFAWPSHALERAWRSARQPKGRTDDRLLTLDSQKNPGAVYTLFVPANYDPFTATPLVIGLHGGGRGGKDGSGVVGSGRQAMDFFQEGAARLGWLVACPTALRAPWSAPENDGALLAVLEEVSVLFNVDRNRVYLAGHSMGGFGAWHFGSKYCHLWAAISPNAGGGSPDLKRLEDTLTGVYLYHGANDEVVSAETDRGIAAQMRDRGMDFVYCEVPDSGHSWPDDVRAEMWEFFRVRRLGVAPGRAERGKFAVAEESFSSFLEKPSRAETLAFGSFGTASAGQGSPTKSLLSDLAAGGGRAEKAAERLAGMRDPKVATDVAKILADASLATDARRFAAVALGRMGQASALKALRRATLDESLPVCAAAAQACGSLQDPEAKKVFKQAAQALADRFEKKKSGGRMDFTDFAAHLDAAVSMTEGVAAAKDAGCAPVLQFVLEQFLLTPLEVPVSERAGQDAAVPRRRLARALAAACGALGTAAVRPTLEVLAARSDLGAEDQAKQALATLPAQ